MSKPIKKTAANKAGAIRHENKLLQKTYFENAKRKPTVGTLFADRNANRPFADKWFFEPSAFKYDPIVLPRGNYPNNNCIIPPEMYRLPQFDLQKSRSNLMKQLSDKQKLAQMNNNTSMNKRKRRNVAGIESNTMIIEPSRKRQKLSETMDLMGESKNEQKKSAVCHRDHEEENELLMIQMKQWRKQMKKIDNTNSNTMEIDNNDKCTKLSQENKELKEEVNKLKNKLNLIGFDMDNVEALNEEQLNDLEVKLQEKHQNNLKIIREARDRLMDDKLRCIVCLKNEKNIVIQGCNHFDLCSDCLSKLDKKVCPRCQKPFDDFIQLNV